MEYLEPTIAEKIEAFEIWMGTAARRLGDIVQVRRNIPIAVSGTVPSPDQTIFGDVGFVFVTINITPGFIDELMASTQFARSATALAYCLESSIPVLNVDPWRINR